MGLETFCQFFRGRDKRGEGRGAGKKTAGPG